MVPTEVAVIARVIRKTFWFVSFNRSVRIAWRVYEALDAHGFVNGGKVRL